MADEQRTRISHLQEGHKGTSAPAPAIATTAKAVSAVPAAKNGSSTASDTK
ncbi:MAG: hypothetical protein QOJ39_3351 [Candidatus Eremiobacteraeota bacterium]|jgi:hypothetical protein|nr:hypothetical protein [Candidatus Eremiobacteraeota bacterium]